MKKLDCSSRWRWRFHCSRHSRPKSWAQSLAPGWDKLVADAKKEGKVVIIAPSDPQVREAIPAAFKAKYGITVEYLGGRSSDMAARLRTERQAGHLHHRRRAFRHAHDGVHLLRREDARSAPAGPHRSGRHRRFQMEGRQTLVHRSGRQIHPADLQYPHADVLPEHQIREAGGNPVGPGPAQSEIPGQDRHIRSDLAGDRQQQLRALLYPVRRGLRQKALHRPENRAEPRPPADRRRACARRLAYRDGSGRRGNGEARKRKASRFIGSTA